MKFIRLLIILSILGLCTNSWAFYGLANPGTHPTGGVVSSVNNKPIKPPVFTVATLPVLTASDTYALAAVSDGDGVDCTTGGGTDKVLCYWTSSAWAPVDTQAAGSAEIQDEVYSAANFNGDTAHGVSQDDFYDIFHIADTDDDGKINVLDLAAAELVKTDANGVVSSATAGTDYYAPGGTDVALADGGTGASLADPGADRIFFWDDSESTVAFLTVSTGLAITTASITIDSSVLTTSTDFTGGDVSSGTYNTIQINEAGLDHDSLGGYVANEHIDWTGDQGATNISTANLGNLGDATDIGITAGDSYSNFSTSADDDTLNELFAALDTALGLVGGGSGDVTGVGDCTDGACLDGSSDGGTYIRLYDGDSHYTSLASSDVSGNTAIVLPAAAGTLVTSAEVLTLTNVSAFTPDADYEPATKKYVDDNISAGSVSAVGDCAGGACFDGTSDGGTQILFYDAQGATTLVGGDTGGAITLTLPAVATGTLYASGNTDVALADGGTGASLSDPGADRIMFWDDDPGATAYLTVGTGLAISTTTITADVQTVDTNELTLNSGSLGLANHATARSALGLAIGTNVQAYDADLATLATPTAWRIFYSNGSQNIAEIVLGANGTFLESNGATSIPAFRALEAADIPDISATYEVQLNNAAGLYAVLSDVTAFLEDLVDDTTPQLGGDLDVNSHEIQSTGDIVLQLGDNAGANAWILQDSDGTQVAKIDSDGTFTSGGSGGGNNPTIALNEDDGVDYWVGVYDTTLDRFEVRRSLTPGSSVDFYVDSDGGWIGGNMNIPTAHVYQINGSQINYANLAQGGNATPTGTWNFGSATLQNIGAGTVTDGSNYTTISNDAADDTINELFDAINTWASGVSSGTIAALTDTDITAPSGAQILVWDNSNSWDNKTPGGDVSLTGDGTFTVIGTALSTASTAADYLTAGGMNLDASADTAGDYGYASGAFTWMGGATSEKLIATFGADLITFSSDTSATFAFTQSIALNGGATLGGTLALAANNLTMTGSLAATGARVTKGWFTDIESTNMPTVGGTAILTSLTAPQFTTIEVGAASDTTLSRSAAGVLAAEGKVLPRIIVSGTKALATSEIASGACTAAQDAGTATGVLTTDIIDWGFNADATGITGFGPSTDGGLFIYAYPTADHVNFKVCNNTAAPITPGAMTLNWRVTR